MIGAHCRTPPGRNSKIAWWAARVAGEKAPLVSTRIFGDQQVQWAASKRLSSMLTGLMWMSCVSTKSLSTAYRSPVPLADMAGRTSEKDGSGTGRCSRRAVRAPPGQRLLVRRLYPAANRTAEESGR